MVDGNAHAGSVALLENTFPVRWKKTGVDLGIFRPGARADELNVVNFSVGAGYPLLAMVAIESSDFCGAGRLPTMAPFTVPELLAMSRHPLSLRCAAITGALLMLAVLAGCASSRPALLMDNSQARQIECHGVFGSWAGCRSEAVAVCGGGAYQVLSRNREEGASEAQVDAYNAEVAFQERSMLVRCGVEGPLRVALNG